MKRKMEIVRLLLLEVVVVIRIIINLSFVLCAEWKETGGIQKVKMSV